MKNRLSVYDLLQMKGKRKFLQIHVDNDLEAAAAAEAGIDIISCDSDQKLTAIRAAHPTAFISAGLFHGTIASAEDGIRLGFAAQKLGADSVYCSSSPRIIEAMAREGIPVTGHVGLVPNHAAWTNFRAVGKTPTEAATVYRTFKELERAGACSIEVEVVPVKLAAFLTDTSPVITMGMGVVRPAIHNTCSVATCWHQHRTLSASCQEVCRSGPRVPPRARHPHRRVQGLRGRCGRGHVSPASP
jgi:3-methyl-2-oxobutanoate hydroxymethyltransferase